MPSFNCIDISHWDNDFIPLTNALRSHRTVTLAYTISTDATKLWVYLGAEEIGLARWPGSYLNPAWGLPSVADVFPDAVYLNADPSLSTDFKKITTTDYSDFKSIVDLFRGHSLFVMAYDGRDSHGDPIAWAFVDSEFVSVVIFTTTGTWPTDFATDFPGSVYLGEPPDNLS